MGKAGSWSSMYYLIYCTGNTTALAAGDARVPVF